MKCGVVYKFKPQNKINGSLFYCFEYFHFLKKFIDVKLYLVDITTRDFSLVKKIFEEKYSVGIDNIIPVKTTDLYKINLYHTIVLDIMTFYDCKEFLTNKIHCFSNDSHEMFRYKNDREVKYYGSYNYQNYDEFSYLKLNFEIFKPIKTFADGVFVSSRNIKYIENKKAEWEKKFNKPIFIKKIQDGFGDIFEKIDTVYYVHLEKDTNNRIIPEAFFYGKKVIIDRKCDIIDSTVLRYEDITKNGLKNYTLSEDDLIIQSCLQS